MHGEGHGTARRILVDYVVRADAEAKSGGDMVQIAEYGGYLRDAGFDLRQVPFHPAMTLRDDAVVHVFNIDRPFDFLLACRAAGSRRLVVSPIHHELARVRGMRAAERGRGMRSAAGRVLPERLREWLGTALRSARLSRGAADLVATGRAVAWSAPRAVRMWREAGSALDRADAVALLAEGEGEHLRRLTGWHGRNAVLVPNGRPEELDGAARQPWAERPVGSILVVGRVEPRKRQLELARSADRLGIPVRFVGPISDPGSAWATEFEALAASSASVEHLGALGRTEVLRLFAATRVLVNASWVEVQSLVDLEAATMGCAVVTTPTGHSREWLGDAVTVLDTDDPDALLRTAEAVAAQEAAPAPLGYDWTWQRAAERLAELYRA